MLSMPCCCKLLLLYHSIGTLGPATGHHPRTRGSRWCGGPARLLTRQVMTPHGGDVLKGRGLDQGWKGQGTYIEAVATSLMYQ